MLLGLAVGDSLGNTSEGMRPQDRRARYGEVRDYLPHPHAGGRAVGLPSDDTQLAFWTLEHLLRRGVLAPEQLSAEFTTRRIFGIGDTVRMFIRNRKDAGMPWTHAGVESAGNGALMRIAPVLVPHVGKRSWPHADAALATMITHNDFAAISASVAFVHLLSELLHCSSPPAPEWWITTFTRMQRELEGHQTYRTRTPHITHAGRMSDFIERETLQRLREERDTVSACDHWYSGAYLLETIPSALYILARHGHDPEEAIVRAVNDTWDNDSVAAVVGAAVGALHGRSTLPPRWITGLSGRTGASDDGRVFELIARARAVWGTSN